MANFVQRENAETLNLIRHNATSDYQRRVPDATKGNIDDVFHSIFSYRPNQNEYADALVNQIGREYVIFQSYQNKLAQFKTDAMMFGDTMEEIGVGLTEARRYDPSRNYLEGEIFGQHRPNIKTAFHKQNRQDYYPITVTEAMLKRAFRTPTGMANLVAAILESPTTSDQWDEYLLMAKVIGKMHKMGAFWKQNVPDVSNVSSDAPAARYLLRQARAWSEKLGFIDGNYNLARLETFVKAEDLILLVTPESKAAIDVEALAAAFNVTYAELEARTITVRQQDVGIEGFQALLTGKDFFKVADTYLENTTANNPVGLHQNYYLHHHQIISASPMVPGILFTSTEASDEIVFENTPVTSVEIHVEDNDGNTVTTVERGKYYRVVGTAVTTPLGGYNDAVRLGITPGYSSMLTYVRAEGQISIGQDEDAGSLTINAYAEDSPLPELSASVTVSVVGAKVDYPPLAVDEDPDNDGLFNVTAEAPTFDDDETVTVPDIEGVVYKVGSVVQTPGDHVIAAATTYVASADTGYELNAGVTSWTFTPA